MRDSSPKTVPLGFGSSSWACTCHGALALACVSTFRFRGVSPLRQRTTTDVTAMGPRALAMSTSQFDCPAGNTTDVNRPKPSTAPAACPDTVRLWRAKRRNEQHIRAA